MANDPLFYQTIQDSAKAFTHEKAEHDVLALYGFREFDFDEAVSQPFRLNAYTVGWVAGGELNLLGNHQTHHLKTGAVFCFAPWHIRAYQETKAWKGYILWISPALFTQFNADPVTDLMQLPIFQTTDGLVVPEVEPQHFRFLQTILEAMLMIQQLDESNELKILYHHTQALLYHLNHILSVYIDFRNTPKAGIIASFLAQVNQYFIDKYAGQVQEPLTIQYVAGQLNLHPHYLSSLIKKETGTTAVQWIKQRVAQEASGLLKSTSLSVHEIALQLGFMDTSNFAKFFKSFYQMAPIQYRQQNK